MSSDPTDTYVHEKAVCWDPCWIGPKTWIGANVSIGRFSEVSHSTIGAGTRIQSGAKIYDATVSENVFIGPNVVICNVKRPKTDGTGIRDSVVVLDGAVIGAGSVIIPGVVIGEDAFVGAGSVVTRNVRPRTVVYGNPAQERGPWPPYGEQEP